MIYINDVITQQLSEQTQQSQTDMNTLFIHTEMFWQNPAQTTNTHQRMEA